MSSASRPIVIVGSANMDLVVRVRQLPLPGETLLAQGFETVPGGKGANQAIAAARLGGSVALAGCVGTDAFGQRLHADLEKEGIDLSHFHHVAEQPTGIAAITVATDGANTIAVALGANASLRPQNMDDAEALIAAAGLLVCQLETPLETVERAIDLAMRHKTRVILNAAPAMPLADALLRKIDYLVVNESEASLISGITVENIETAGRAAEALLKRGARHVLLTLGAQGLWYAGGDDETGGEHIPGIAVQTVDTTAAGDTFIGGFAAGLASGMNIGGAIDLGQRAAAISVTRRGAQTSIPYRSELVA